MGLLDLADQRGSGPGPLEPTPARAQAGSDAGLRLGYGL